MSFRRLTLVVAAVAVLSAPMAAALSSEHTEFGKGPAQWIMTADEAKAWKAIKQDADAEKFIALFWARRDPTPATPANEWREEFDRRVKYTDEKLAYGRTKGSMTDRGKALIVFGPPTRIVKQQAGQAIGEGAGFEDPSIASAAGSAEISSEAWIYEGTHVSPALGVTKMTLLFNDVTNRGDYKLGRSPDTKVGDAMTKIVNALVVNPSLTEVPTYTAQAAPAAAPVPPPAPKLATELKTASLTAAVAEIKGAAKNPYRSANVSYGEFVTADGVYFTAVSLYVPGDAGVTPADALTMFGVIEDPSGVVVAAFEETAKLIATKNDFYADHSIQVPAGKYVATIGLAKDGKPIMASRMPMELAAIEASVAGTSRLLVSNNIYALSEAQRTTDPYSFGGMKVVPKGDHVFTREDEMWYFVELRNPGVGEDSLPKFQSKLDVEGVVDGKTKKMSAPLQSAVAEPLKGVPGHYAIGSSIPLAGFKPGDYTIKVKLIDTVAQKTYELKETFKVTGSAPAAPAK